MRILIFSSVWFFILSVVSLASWQFDSLEASGKSGMVVSAEPIATSIGLTVLKNGGNAFDAAVAVGFALAVTYPVAGNIGGGGFMVAVDASGNPIAVDYREKSPASAHQDMYLDSTGNVHPTLPLLGASASGVPGSVAGMIHILEKYGTMTLSEILEPIIALADTGFLIPDYLAKSLASQNSDFNRFSSSKAIFTNDGEPKITGERLIQKDLAATLRAISDYGTDGFYQGKVADLIVAQMQASGGYITHKDLDEYHTIERKAISSTYRGYNLFSMPPPSSGGVALFEMLSLLENADLSKMNTCSAEYMHLLASAAKFAYADRAEYLGDPDFVRVPVERLISKAHGKRLFARVTEIALPSDSISHTEFSDTESQETTHYSVLDQFGNAVSITTTINSGYGCKEVVEGAGFLLNNEMDDFSAKPGVPNQFGLIGSKANAIQPGKRMLSSMTPTIALQNGKPVLILGSPGGSTIITVVLQVLLNVLDHNMDVGQAVAHGRIHHQWRPDILMYEETKFLDSELELLRQKGYSIRPVSRLGLVEAIFADPITGMIQGATDPRGNGMAAGY